MQKITPNLWFDSDAEQAARLYASLIPGSRIGPITEAFLAMKKFDVETLERAFAA